MQDGQGSAPLEDFNPVIISRGSGYCIHLAEFNVSGEGPTLEDAYRQYKSNFTAARERSAKYGLPLEGLQSATPLRKPRLWQELSLSFTKVAVTSAAVIIVVILLLPNIGAAMRNQAQTLIPATLKDPMYWLVQIPAKINSRLDRMDPAETDKMTKEWGKLLDRTGPAVRALKCQP